MVYLTDAFGHQSVHIAPEAFTVATAEFGDEVSVWQNALPGALKGKLESVSALAAVVKLELIGFVSSFLVLKSLPLTARIL